MTSRPSSAVTWTCRWSSISAEEADEHFGFLSAFGSFDNPTSSALTQKVLDWHPDGPGLIEDLDAGHYFNEG